MSGCGRRWTELPSGAIHVRPKGRWGPFVATPVESLLPIQDVLYLHKEAAKLRGVFLRHQVDSRLSYLGSFREEAEELLSFFHAHFWSIKTIC